MLQPDTGGEPGLCSRLLDWEGQDLVFSDEIPRHMQTQTRPNPTAEEKKKSCNPNRKENMPTWSFVLVNKLFVKRKIKV